MAVALFSQHRVVVMWRQVDFPINIEFQLGYTFVLAFVLHCYLPNLTKLRYLQLLLFATVSASS